MVSGEAKEKPSLCSINLNRKAFHVFYLCVCVENTSHDFICPIQNQYHAIHSQSTSQMALCEQRNWELNLSEVPAVGFPREELFIYLMFFIHSLLSAHWTFFFWTVNKSYTDMDSKEETSPNFAENYW